MTKNLVAIGNSLGIIIEKPILDLLKIERETPLEVTTDGVSLFIKPIFSETSVLKLEDNSGNLAT